MTLGFESFAKGSSTNYGQVLTADARNPQGMAVEQEAQRLSSHSGGSLL